MSNPAFPSPVIVQGKATWEHAGSGPVRWQEGGGRGEERRRKQGGEGIAGSNGRVEKRREEGGEGRAGSNGRGEGRRGKRSEGGGKGVEEGEEGGREEGRKELGGSAPAAGPCCLRRKHLRAPET